MTKNKQAERNLLQDIKTQAKVSDTKKNRKIVHQSGVQLPHSELH